MRLPVTYLFVPGNRPDRFDKAVAAGPDAVILDLEDAVDPGDKDTAREAIASFLDVPREGPALLVRINDATTPWFGADIARLSRSRVAGVMLPKAESAVEIADASAALATDGYILPLIETARGLNLVHEIAAAPRVQRLAFGTLDFAVDIELSGDERGLIAPALAIAVASRCADRAPPVAGVTAAIDDAKALARDIAFARATGFTAKLCIHPQQVEAVARALAPTPAEIDWARRVIAAVPGGAGAVRVDGKMVDRPVLLRARAILDRAPLSSHTSN